MKPFASVLLMLLFFISALTLQAQKTIIRQPLFSSYPNIINCNALELTRIFNATGNQSIDVALSPAFSFAGTVISNTIKYSNLQTVLIKSPLLSNTIFSISKRTDVDNGITYVGRIINQSYSDGYELKKDIAGNYRLVKFETGKVIQDCSNQ